MPTTRLAAALASLCLILAPATAWSQDDAPADGDGQAQADQTPPGPDGEAAVPQVPRQGENYTVETFQDWGLRCVRIERIEDPCEIHQTLRDTGDVTTAEINVFPLPDREGVAAGATIVTPLNTLLPQGVTLAVDGASGKRYPFAFCNRVGCVAQVGFTAEEVESMKRGRTATLSLVPVAAPDQTVTLDVSLLGFTAAYDALQARPQPQPQSEGQQDPQ